MSKLFKRILCILFALVLLLTGGLYLLLRRSLPQTEGSVKLSILEAPVEVYRDDNGVPSLIAANELDVYRAQGYVHAQDRLFQMDLARRQASGMLAEVIGPAALDNDKKFLTFSLRRAAEASLAAYSAHGRAILEAYAAGVNAYIDQAIQKHALPYEFTLLGYQPAHWSPADSLVIGKYMAYDLNYCYDYAAFNSWALTHLGEDALRDLLPEDFYQNPDNVELLRLNQSVTAKIDRRAALLPRPNEENGSNNWVLAPSKTTTGQALLADDPHLDLGTPSIWYQMHLKTPDMDVAGVIFAGIPGIILGHNQDIAWGVTNVGPDVQDLYIERVNPDNPRQLEYDGAYYDAEVVEHSIKVKGQPDESFTLLYSRHGVIIDELVKPLDSAYRYAMQWTALEATRELEAIININHAKNWEEFETALLDFKAPAQNFVFADKKGNIGFKANGNVPIRKKGTAALPVPGYLSEYGWEGYVPFDQLPRIVNPESGYIHTANTKTITDYPIFLSNTWAQPYRYNRIGEVLSEDRKLSAEDMMALQMDYKNLHAAEFLDQMLAKTTEMPDAIRSMLQEWNRYDDKEQAAPLVFDTWMRVLRRTLYAAHMPEEVYAFMPSKPYLTDRILRNVLDKGQRSYFVEAAGGIESLLNRSLQDALQTISDKYGKEPGEWKWGKHHYSQFLHPIGKSSQILGFFLNSAAAPVHGSAVTVRASRQTDAGHVNNGASWRFVYDFQSQTGHHIVAPGQSGHFLSPYYSNQVSDWNEGSYNIKDTQNISQAHRLTLEP